MPNMKLTKSPYLLQPYGDAQLLKPLGQIDLLCKRNKRYESLTFQILPREIMMNKPTLLSGSDCYALGLITIKADEIFSLTSAVKDSTGKRISTYQASESFSHILGSFQLCSSWRDSRGCLLEQGNLLYKFLLAWYARFLRTVPSSFSGPNHSWSLTFEAFWIMHIVCPQTFLRFYVVWSLKVCFCCYLLCFCSRLLKHCWLICLCRCLILVNGVSSHCGALGQILFKLDSLDLSYTLVLTSPGT